MTELVLTLCLNKESSDSRTPESLRAESNSNECCPKVCRDCVVSWLGSYNSLQFPFKYKIFWSSHHQGPPNICSERVLVAPAPAVTIWQWSNTPGPALLLPQCLTAPAPTHRGEGGDILVNNAFYRIAPGSLGLKTNLLFKSLNLSGLSC